jgi:L-ascorbate metabolism protein UlaG (beta-lactamase superfamily)
MSDHFDGKRFFNPTFPHGRKLSDLLRWMCTRKKAPWPRWLDNEPVPGPPGAVGPDELALTFINQATFLVQMAGCTLLTDPIWSERASPFSWIGPRRVRPPGLAWEQLPAIDLVLISHNHYDHMDLPTLRRLEERFRPLLLTGLGNRAFLRNHGLDNVQELDWWQSKEVAPGIRVTMTPAQHFSARGLFDQNRTLWGGFVVEWPAGVVYFAGDSGYASHFAAIAQRWPQLDVALLPFAAYEPRWFMKPAHMNAAEAVQAHGDLNPRLTVGMHFGTFQLTDEPMDEPMLALRQALTEQGVAPGAFVVPGFGETICLTQPAANHRNLS